MANVFGVLVTAVAFGASLTTGMPSDLGPLCRICKNVDNPSACNTTNLCNIDEICFIMETTQFNVKRYTQKCEQKQICEALERGPDFVGRKKRRVAAQSAPATCLNCCSTDLCNDHCGTGKPGTSVGKNAKTNVDGKRFLVVFLSNFNHYSQAYAQLMINSRSNGWLSVNLPSLNIHQNKSMRAGVNVITLPNSVKTESFRTESKGIWIETSHNVSVYALNHETFTSDAYYVIPIKYLTSEYVIVTIDPPSVERSALMAVSPVENNTMINFTVNTKGSFSYNGHNYGNNSVFSITLDKHETFEIKHIHDLTGTKITSNKPIAAVSGNVLGTLSSHTSEMIPPTKSLDKRYIIPTFPAEYTARFVRVVEVYPSTSINFTIDGVTSNKIINASKFSTWEINFSSSFVSLETSKSVLVSVRAFRAYRSDPFMAVIPGTNNYLSNYTFSVPDAGFTNYISMIIKSGYKSGLRVDGVAISVNCKAEERAFSEDMICLLEKSVTTGFHTMYHDANEPFGLFVYGLRYSDTYGYFAGMEF